MGDDESSTYENNCYCGIRGFCVYPNGKYIVVPQTLSIIAATLSITAFINCSFVYLYTEPCDDWVCYTDRIGVGFVWHEDKSEFFREGMAGLGSCVGWTNSDGIKFLDLWFQLSFSFSLSAAAIGFITCVMLIAASCGAFGRKVFVWLAILQFLCFIFEGLSLLVFLSDTCTFDEGDITFFGCSFARGARLAVVATIFWFASSIATYIENSPVAASMLPK
mmetsp:Transcript_30891/g.41235  ORF Transcript_30891/g.41235 Transcript_30891/m.41235 type:complete len:220 (+) Transcript_30891:174-833(+)